MSTVNPPFVLVILTVLSTISVAEDVSFRRDIAPLLLSNCVACHSATTAEGDYRTDSFAAISKAGDSELSPIDLKDVDQSELLRRISTNDEDERMPAESDALPAKSIGLIRKWIQQGARYDAKDPNASLASILPIAKHPTAPAFYRYPIPLTAISFVGDDVVVGGYHELLRWNVEAQKVALRIEQIGERVYAIEYDKGRDRLYVASGSPGKLGEVRVLNASDGRLIGVPLVSNEVFHDVSLHPNNDLLAVAGGDRKLYVIDVRSMQTVKTFDSHSDWIRAVTWNQSGDRLATASRDKTAKLFSLDAENPLATYAGHAEDVVDVCFVEGKQEELISCDARGGVHRSNPKKEDKGKKFDVTAKDAIRLQADGDGVWVSSSKAATKFSWKGTKLEKQRTPQGGLSIAVDSKRLAMSDAKGGVRLWMKDAKGKVSTKQQAIEIYPLPMTD